MKIILKLNFFSSKLIANSISLFTSTINAKPLLYELLLKISLKNKGDMKIIQYGKYWKTCFP